MVLALRSSERHLLAYPIFYFDPSIFNSRTLVVYTGLMFVVAITWTVLHAPKEAPDTNNDNTVRVGLASVVNCTDTTGKSSPPLHVRGVRWLVVCCHPP